MSYYWHHLCWQPFLHVQKVNYACSSTVYSALHSLRTATYYSGNYARLIAASLASRFGSGLYGWSMAFLRKLVTCARKWVWGVWLASGIPEEIGYLRWQVELGMSYVAGRWHSWGNWLPVLASGVGYELCGWPLAFLRKMTTCAGK